MNNQKTGKTNRSFWPLIYGWAAVIVLFAFIPLFIGAKDYVKRKKVNCE